MNVKLKKMGVQLIPMESIEMKFWKAIRTVINGMAVFNCYQLEEEHGLTITHLDQDEVADGEYDLPLKPLDFFPETTGLNFYEGVI